MEKLSNQQASNMVKMMVSSFCNGCSVSVPEEIEVPYDRNRKPEDEYYQFAVKAESNTEKFGLIFSIKIYTYDLKRTIDNAIHIIFSGKYRTNELQTDAERIKWIKQSNSNIIVNIVALYRRYFDITTPFNDLIHSIMDIPINEEMHLKKG